MTKILLIEDELPLREEVLEWLTYEGYETLGVGDGLSGLETASQEQPDLIICDIMLPGLDGYEVLLELQANPSLMKTPFIFVTAKGTREDIRKGMSLGADDYLTKPFTRNELLQAIRTRLEKKAIQEQEYQQQINSLREMLTHEREQHLLHERMIAMVSHDFRNPLSTILSAAQLMKNYADRMTEEQRIARLSRIEGAVYRLNQMLDELLLAAQMETDHFELKLSPIEVVKFVEDILSEFDLIYEKTHSFHLRHDLPGSVNADARLLRQIIVNLLSNAVKYSPAGSTVQITLRRKGAAMLLSVRDQGIGIPEEDQARLFELFTRASNVGSVPGTGLGLAIVKQAVDLLGGKITVESREGEGSEFCVSLPC